MSTLTVLEVCLLDLLEALGDAAGELIVGGGFGLWLKRRSLAPMTRTLLRVLPAARSTNDLDLFLRAEFVAALDRMRALRRALDGLGYVPVEDAKYMQWARPGDATGHGAEVKVDLLVGPPGLLGPQLRISKPRVRPRGDSGLGLHAHLTPEAVGVEEDPIPARLAGLSSSGSERTGVVYLPQLMPYLVMKLFALHDRKDDLNPKKDKGRHHAMDLYGLVAMMTGPEYEAAREWHNRHGQEDAVRQAAEFVAEDFGGPERTGVVRLREHALFQSEMDVETFRSVLAELFPMGGRGT